jgi:hypothetical protein
MKCRHCEENILQTVLDLGFSPPSNAYLNESDLSQPEVYFPLEILVCENCWLVQTKDYTQAHELFKADYAYFSSTSKSWLNHAKEYVIKVSSELCLGSNSFVIEIASNDGYLLKNFVEAGIPCLGIEPTESTALVSASIGINVLQEFFGEELGRRLASEDKKADLIIGNNVFAHVPDVNDFTRGLKSTLKDGGTITLEFPHVMHLVEKTQFDTVYHEHFSYLSLYSVSRILESSGLRAYDIEELSTHGGSLRVYACHRNDKRLTTDSVREMIEKEKRQGLQSVDGYRKLQSRAEQAKNDFVAFLIQSKKEGKKVVAYGAAAKGNTLLNFGGVKPDLLPFVCDASLSKQGKYMPGSHIPIVSPDVLKNTTPDYIVVLPWNIIDEVTAQLYDLSERGCKFVTAVPSFKIIG